MWSRTHSPVPLVDPERLRFWIDQRLNVLLQGRHGVGKTALVRGAFQAAGLNLLVFSGPTMDPWVDFVGVPRPVKRRDGTSVLELIQRPELADDQVDAIFIDEFNRAPAKVRNAAMEILQFQSVNGRRFERLRMVWAAVNPGETDEYDADRLDPAQLDRFHVRFEVPFRPCPAYFVGRYGCLGKAALEWWDGLGDETQAKVSPRRLDYAVQMILAGGQVRDVLPHEANARKLLQLLEDGPVFDRLKQMLKAGDREGARQLMQDPNSGSQALRHVVGSKAASVFFLPLLDRERLMALLDNPGVLDTVVKYSDNVPEFRDALEALQAGQGNRTILVQAGTLAKKHGVSFKPDGAPRLVNPVQPLEEKDLMELDPYGRVAS